ncbi:tyrosine-type recombinase/integrase [Terriglobus sp.]|uniref:tyrosine-type recombinase/integrase n=1 Tax=Terriglobus sp. TaxID=1889013 RepID=UPI003B003C2B
MPKSAVSLVLRVNHNDGTRTHHAAVMAGNARVKPSWGLVAGKPTALPGSRYYLRYTVKGRRVWEAVGEDPTKALSEKRKRENQLDGLKLGTLIEETSGLRLMSRTGAEVPPSVHHFHDLLATYIRRVETLHPNGRTANQYLRDLTEFGKVTGNKMPTEVTREDIQLFIQHLMRRKMSPKTIQNRLTTVRAFLRTHKVEKVSEIIDKLDAPAVHKKIPHTFSATQVNALLAASGFEERLAWEMFLSAGLREQELSHLGWEDILFERGMLHLHAKPDLKFTLKDGEERQIPLPNDLLTKLQNRRALRANDRLVFPTPEGKPDGHLLRRLKDVAFRAGLNCGRCVNRAGQSCKKYPVCGNWQLHSFRRTAANRWHEAGLTVPSVQRLLGHSDIETTMLYLTGQDLARAEFRESMEKCFAALQQAA